MFGYVLSVACVSTSKWAYVNGRGIKLLTSGDNVEISVDQSSYLNIAQPRLRKLLSPSLAVSTVLFALLL